MRITHLLATGIVAGAFAFGIALPAATTTSGEALAVTPAYVSAVGDGPGGCAPGVSGGSPFVCHVTIRNPGSVSVSWRSWGLDASGQSTLPATVTPNHGTLGPGASVRVTISTGWCGFSLADLANFLAWSSASQAGSPPLGGAVLYSCG
jgi:hypothetical protein